MAQLAVIEIAAQTLEPKSFPPYGEIIRPRAAGEQFANNPYDPETSAEEPKLMLTNGKPRLWIMDLKKNAGFRSPAWRDTGVSANAWGSMQCMEWFIGDSVEKHEPAGDIDTAMVDGLKVLGEATKSRT